MCNACEYNVILNNPIHEFASVTTLSQHFEVFKSFENFEMNKKVGQCIVGRLIMYGAY